MLPSFWSSYRSLLLRYSCSVLGWAFLSLQTLLFAEIQTPEALPLHNMQGSISLKDIIIGRKDTLLYRVLEDRDPPIKLQVSEAGTVFIPYYGELVVAGKSLEEVKSTLTLALESSFYKKATVFISLEQESNSLSPSLVYLGGKVNKVGAIPLDPMKQNTVTKVILAAGGFADFADDSKVKLVRKALDTGKISTFYVDVASILEKGELDKDLDVTDGDFIIVPKRLFNW